MACSCIREHRHLDSSVKEMKRCVDIYFRGNKFLTPGNFWCELKVARTIEKCDVTKIKICEIMRLVRIFRKSKKKNTRLLKISLLVQIGWEI